MKTSTVVYCIQNHFHPYFAIFVFNVETSLLLCRSNKLDCIFVFADFISCLSPEKPRNIALIYSISLKRVQRWRVSLIRSANDKNNRLSCLYANMSLLFSFNSNMKNTLEIYVFSEWITTQYYVFFLAADLNPCLNVHCSRSGFCRTYSAHDARCECDDQCPSYKDPVCTANGTTYDNLCWHNLSYCRGLENNMVYHPGSCEGNEN